MFIVRGGWLSDIHRLALIGVRRSA